MKNAHSHGIFIPIFLRTHIIQKREHKVTQQTKRKSTEKIVASRLDGDTIYITAALRLV